MADRISGLPEEIILNIISHLPFRDAVATCTLSRQWQYLWHSITAIKLGGSDPTPIHLVGKKRELSYDPEIDKQTRLMKEYVERTRCPTLEEITVCYFMDTRHQKFVRFLYAFAMKKNVKKLHLESWVSCFSQSCLPLPFFPGYDDIIPSKLLKDLHLSNVGLNKHDIQYLLSNCPVLEKLTLIDSHSLLNLRVVGPLALKELQIQRCGVLNSIEIHDTKLVRFSYIGDEFDLLLNNVPFLADVSIEILAKNRYWQSRQVFIHSLCTQLVLSGCLSGLQRIKFDVRSLGYHKNYLLWLLKEMALKVAPNCRWDVVY